MNSNLKSNLNTFDKLNIVYKTCTMTTYTKDNKIKKDVDKCERFKLSDYDKPLTTSFNPNHNSSMVPMGGSYGLIGIDVDTGNNTLYKWDKFLTTVKNFEDYNTLKVKTINNGCHYYFKVTDKQKEILKNWAGSNGGVFEGLSVDIKYHHQFLYGPSSIDFNGINLEYKIINNVPPKKLPYEIMNKIINFMNPSPKGDKLTTKLNKDLESSPKWDALTELERALSCIPNNKNGQTYDNWFKVGCIIKNEGGTVEDWINWSNNCDRYTDQSETCREYWEKNLNKPKLRIGALINMAKKYQPDYIKLRKMNDTKQISFNVSKEVDALIEGGEAGHAKLFMKAHKGEIFVVGEKGSKMYVYDNKTRLWCKHGKGVLIKFIKKFLNKKLNKLRKDYTEKLNTGSSEERTRTQLILNAIKIQNNKVTMYNHLNHVLECCYGYNVDIEFITKLNNIPNLLPTRGGTVVDLQMGTIRKRQANDYFTFESTVFYLGESSETPNADKFFNQIMNNKKDVVKYLQKCLGYCLTGETSSRALFLFWGAGHNGKSTLCELLELVVTDKYYTPVDQSIFIDMGKRRSGATPERMQLIEKRIGVYSESKEKEELNDSSLKTISGNDKMTARHLYQDPLVFRPVIKLIMMTNYRPIFNSDDIAMWERLKYLPFNASFTHEPKEGEFKRDVEFIDKLKTIYLDEVFTFLVKGAIEWYKDKKLTEPESVKDATLEYMAELDFTSQFIQEKCERGPDFRVERKVLYDAYCDFIIDEGGKKMSKPAFFKKMTSLKFDQTTMRGVDNFKGLKLKNDPTNGTNYMASRLDNII